jgi:hypothetical protein
MAHASLPRGLFALLLIVLAFAGGLACGKDDDGDAGPKGEAAALLERAATTPVTTAQLKGSVGWEIVGFPIFGSGPMEIAGGARVQSNGTSTLPTSDGDFYFEGGGQSFPIGVTTTPRNGWVEFMGRAYQVLPRPAAAVPAPNAGGTPVTLKQLGLEPQTWFRSATVTGGPEIGGDPTRRVTGAVDVEAMLSDFVGALRSATLAPLLRSAGAGVKVPELRDEQVARLAKSVTAFTATVDVDAEGVPRRVAGTIRFKVPDAEKSKGIESGTIRFQVTVEKVGVKVFALPPDKADSLASLLRFASRAFGFDAGS